MTALHSDGYLHAMGRWETRYNVDPPSGRPGFAFIHQGMYSAVGQGPSGTITAWGDSRNGGSGAPTEVGS